MPSGGADTGEAGDNAGGAAAAYRPMPNPASSDLPNPADYDTTEAEVVLDRVTQLMWQRVADGAQLAPAAVAKTRCEALTLAGHDDWRLPTRLELATLHDFTTQEPAFDELAFVVASPATAGRMYWSSTPYADAPTSESWIMNFNAGTTSGVSNSTNYLVRCVRGEIFAPQFAVGNAALEGTVTDLTTGLQWQQTFPDAHQYFADVQTLCAEIVLGGFDDWRLPSINELQTLVDDARPAPPIDSIVFPPEEYADARLWSSSTAVSGPSPGSQWVLDFSTGQSKDYTSGNHARCVRWPAP